MTLTNEQILLTLASRCYEVRKMIYLDHKIDKKDLTSDKLKSLVDECKVDLEEIYCHYLDAVFGPVADYTIETENKIRFENFFWTPKSDVGEGAWIRVKTEKGFNVYYAKKSKKTIDFDKVLRKCELESRSMQRILDSNAEGLTSQELGDEWDKKDKSFKDYEYHETLKEINLQPIFVSVRKTKTQKTYLAPTEYELVNDINVYVDIVMNHKTDGVKAKAIYTSENEDMIFYIQSRGISRERAKMLALLQQCHFVVEWEKLYEMG
jgi:hypothetical protein